MAAHCSGPSHSQCLIHRCLPETHRTTSELRETTVAAAGLGDDWLGERIGDCRPVWRICDGGKQNDTAGWIVAPRWQRAPSRSSDVRWFRGIGGSSDRVIRRHHSKRAVFGIGDLNAEKSLASKPATLCNQAACRCLTAVLRTYGGILRSRRIVSLLARRGTRTNKPAAVARQTNHRSIHPSCHRLQTCCCG